MVRRLLVPLAVAATALLVVGLGVWVLDLLSGSPAGAESLRPIVLGSSQMTTAGPGGVGSSTLPVTTSTTLHHPDGARHETVPAPVQSRSTGMMAPSTTTRTRTMSTATTMHHSYDGGSGGMTAPTHDSGGMHDGAMHDGHGG